MFYLNSTLSFVIPPVLVFQLEVSCKVDRLLIGLTAQQKGTTARWYSNKTSLVSSLSAYDHLAGDYLSQTCYYSFYFTCLCPFIALCLYVLLNSDVC